MPGPRGSGTCPQSDDGVTVCGEVSANGKKDVNPYQGFQAVIFDSGDLTVITRRFGLTLHRDIQKFSFYANKVQSMESGCFKHLTRVYTYSMGGNKLLEITQGTFMGMESLEMFWQFGHNDLTTIPGRWKRMRMRTLRDTLNVLEARMGALHAVPHRWPLETRTLLLFLC